MPAHATHACRPPRNALSKLQYLHSLVQVDRSDLPWKGPGDAYDELKSAVVEL